MSYQPRCPRPRFLQAQVEGCKRHAEDVYVQVARGVELEGNNSLQDASFSDHAWRCIVVKTALVHGRASKDRREGRKSPSVTCASRAMCKTSKDGLRKYHVAPIFEGLPFVQRIPFMWHPNQRRQKD
jgi:hypothetical protein